MLSLWELHGIARYLVALLPMLPGIAFCWMTVRRIQDGDEFQKVIQTKAICFSFTTTAISTFSYGFLETVGFPVLSMFWVWGCLSFFWALGYLLFNWKYQWGTNWKTCARCNHCLRIRSGPKWAFRARRSMPLKLDAMLQVCHWHWKSHIFLKCPLKIFLCLMTELNILRIQFCFHIKHNQGRIPLPQIISISSVKRPVPPPSLLFKWGGIIHGFTEPENHKNQIYF